MSKAVQELLEQANARYSEAKTILLDPAATADDLTKADGLRAEADGLKARASKLKLIELAADEMATDVEAAQAQEQSAAKNSAKLPKHFKSWDELVGVIVDTWREGHITDDRLRKFRDIGEEAAEDSAGRSSKQQAVRKQGKSLSSVSGSSAGYTIPIENYAQLMAVTAPLTVVRQRATILRMRRRQIVLRLLDQTGAVAGVPSFFGGIQAYWTEEAATKDITDVKFRNTTLTAHKMVCYTEAPDELLEDADTSLADFLGGNLGFPGAIAWFEDYSFLRGSGVGQPQGVVDAPATIPVTRTTAMDIKYDDLIKIEGAFMGTDGVWVATQAAKAKLLGMNGPSGNPSYLWGNAEQGAANMLMGSPIIFVDKLPGVGTRGDIGKYDFKYFVVADRQATTFEATTTYKFRTDETAFRAVHRVDGMPWLSAPITLAGDGATQVSPFVVLNT